ncbi:MAG: hypothetical protein PUE08_02215 [Eubacteriales bacterium]|nr:hypothetical protein [Eubacteriales bacterium]
MNYVDLFLAVLVAVIVYLGFRKGLFISLLGLARVVAGVPLSLYVGEAYNQQIYDKFIREYLLNRITQSISESSQLSDISTSLKNLADSFSFLFSGKTDLTLINTLTPENAAVYITDNIVQPVATEIVKLVLIVLTFLIFYAITGIIISIAKKNRNKKREKNKEKKHHPVFTANSFLGGVFSLLKALVFILLLGAVSDFVIEIAPQENEFIKQLEGSAILDFVNNFNPIITTLNK